MKLLIVGVQHAIAVLVEDGHEEEALATAMAAIQAGEVKPLDLFALPAKALKDVPPDWHDQPPYVGSAVSDEAFTTVTQDGEAVAAILKRLR